MNYFEKNITEFNRQLSEKNLRASNLQKLSGARPDVIVIAGMGGSGLAGEVLKRVKKEIGLDMPVILWKDYGLPDVSEFRMKRPLYIFASFSGNTEETLSGFKKVIGSKKNLVAAVTTGGELKKISERKNVPLVRFPAGSLTPRQSVGIMFYGLTKILKAAGLNLKAGNYSDKLKPNAFRKEGKKLALFIKNRVISIYTDENRKHLGYIWKVKLNETAKNPAFNNVLPEMNHNEIAGFENGKFKTAAIFLGDASNPRTEKRFGITEQLLKKEGVKIFRIKLSGKTGLEKTWRALILADWTSYFLAKLNKFNPTKTKSIDKLKALMRK